MTGQYGQFNTGDFNFSDIWSAGNDQGLNQGQYQSLADSLGWGGNILDSGTFNESDPMSSMGYQAYLQNPTSPDPSNMRISGDWLDSGFKDSLSGVRVQNAWDEKGNQNWNVFGPGNKQLNSFNMYKPDSSFDKLVGQVAPMAFTGVFGGGLANLFGGGFTGGALGQGLASGTMSAGQGGDFGKGFLSGAIGGGLQGLSAGTPAIMGNNPSAYVPATPGTSMASLTGVTNPTLAGMINRGTGSALGSLAAGKSGSEILQSGLTGAALSGLNSAGKGAMDFYKNSLTEWLGGGNTQADYSTGSTSYGSNYMAPGQSALREAGLFPDRSNIPPSSSNFSDLNTIGLPSLESNPLMNASYGAGGYRPMGADILEQAGVRPGMSYAPPGSAGDMSSDFLSSFSGGPSVPDQRISSVQQSDFSLPSVFGDVGRSVGNFALNNAGDLASMLYGFYNNRKQQKALGQQISSLQGLYGQNSPYAQQLRNTLNAKAAASGRRSNVAGRETQFQAQLADRAASMAPTLMQLNQAQGQLKNSLGSNALSMFGKMGGFNAINKGLGNLFGPSTTTIPYNNGNVSGSDMFGWKGSGGM